MLGMEGGNKAQLVGLRGFAGGSGEVHGFKIVAPIGAQIVSQLVKPAGCIKITSGYLAATFSAGSDSQKACVKSIGRLLDHVFHDSLGVGAFRYILRLDQLDIGRSS